MTTPYHVHVWTRAVREAESDVMRLTATPEGGRFQTESLPEYVARVRRMQDEALDRWETARAELEEVRLSVEGRRS